MRLHDPSFCQILTRKREKGGERFFAIILILLLQTSIRTSASANDNFIESSAFSQRLKGRTNSIVDGKTFRSALERLTSANQLNLWLDRQVNPSAKIETGPVGPNVFLALQKIAASQSCEVMPIGNVVLVGRSAWIDLLTAEILRSSTSKANQPINVQWEDLTTPAEAISQVLGPSAAQRLKLPHDHWPATNLRQIQKRTAQILIEGQFNLGRIDPRNTVEKPLQPEVKIERTYQLQASTARHAWNDLPKLVPDALIKKSASGLLVRTPARGHRLVTQWVLSRHESTAGVDLDNDTFSLNRLSTSAENAFQQLAKTANLECVITPKAETACKRLVTLEGKDVTLRFLIEKIAKEIDVQIEWQPAAIIISNPGNSDR